MKKIRGTGLVYRPTYVDKGSGERKTASTWWIQYSVRGARFRESSGSQSRSDAENLLNSDCKRLRGANHSAATLEGQRLRILREF